MGTPTRITPAWAGKRDGFRTMQRPRRDHPRVGGEKIGGTWERVEGEGSPPRGRGKALDHNDQSAGQGITPAWAGKSPNLVVHGALIQDHPRVGGEKLRLF